MSLLDHTGTQSYLNIRKAFLMRVENLEMYNSLKWIPFNGVSGQITGKVCCGSEVRYFHSEFDLFFYSLERS